MVKMEPINLENCNVIGIEVKYPKTTLLSIVVPNVGYIMCGLLNTNALDVLHGDREIIAACLTGVKNFEDLLNAGIKEMTLKAASIGIKVGMTGKEALDLMAKHGGGI